MNNIETPGSILIVDDEHYVRQSFVFYFEDRLWDASSVESGEEALDRLASRACDAAVVDIRMGGMDGESFIRKASGLYPGMVFVICTGSPEYRISDEFLANPRISNRIFSKPVTCIDELEETVLGLLPD